MDFKDGNQFFQQFEELAFYTDVRNNKQVMIAQIKRATHETSKNTIYMANGDLPTIYDQWKAHLLRIDYNWRLKQAEGAGRCVDSKSQASKTTIPKGVASTSVLTQKTASGTTYGGSGVPWISAQQLQRQSVTDAERSVTLNVTAPTHQKPGRKLCIGSTLTGTTIQQ